MLLKKNIQGVFYCLKYVYKTVLATRCKTLEHITSTVWLQTVRVQIMKCVLFIDEVRTEERAGLSLIANLYIFGIALSTAFYTTAPLLVFRALA